MKKNIYALISCIFLLSLCCCSMTQPDHGSEQSEMKRLVNEMPELGSLMEGLNAYFVHVYTADMPIWDNEEETKRLLNALRSEIDSSAQIRSRPYATKTKYTIYYGPYASKLEAARMAKKIKDAGYSFNINLTESSSSTPNFMYLESLTGACNLNRKPLIVLASNHFLFKFKHEVDFDNNEIELSGYFTTNIYVNYGKKKHPRTLKNIDIKVFFLDINRSGLIHSDGFSLKYEDGEEPSIFDKIPFKVRFPFNLEYRNVSFQYSAELLPITVDQ